jgi:uncharacterized DUF497 family protein
MIFEWDEVKRAANLAKHGVDFGAVRSFDWENAARRPDIRRDYGETRWWSSGFIGTRLYVHIFTWRGEHVRVISLRKASDKEKEDHEAKADP